MSKNRHQDVEPLNWDDLRFFLSLARAGTVLHSAKGLGVSRSTVVRRLDGLERSMGSTLFERTRAGFTLTAAGELLVRAAERIEGEAIATQRAFAGRDPNLSGPLHLTTFDFGVQLLAPVFEAFGRAHPAVELSVSTTNTRFDLDRREADLAIRVTDAPPPHLFGRMLGRLEFGLFCAPSRRDDPDPPWILPQEHLRADQSWAFARARAREFRVAARIDSMYASIALIERGIGVGILPLALARLHPDLCPLGEVPLPRMDASVWALTHPDLRTTARVRAMLRMLGEQAPALLHPP